MPNQPIPSRWDFEVRVVTPDHLVLTNRVSYPPEYMDGGLVEHFFGALRADLVHELREKGYLN